MYQCSFEERINARAHLQLLACHGDGCGLGFCQSNLAGVVWSILAKSCCSYKTLKTIDIPGIVPSCRDTEYPFDGLGTPLREAGKKVLCDVIVDTAQEVAEVAFGVGMRNVLILVMVLGVQVQLEVFLQVGCRVVGLARETPSRKVASLTTVRNTSGDFIGNFTDYGSPLLKSLGSCPVWSSAIGDAYGLGQPASWIERYATPTALSHAKVNADDKLWHIFTRHFHT